MFSFLFPRLTEQPAGAALFDSLTAEARRVGWYVEGQVPDTIDGRFRVLATLTALAIIRLEAAGEEGLSGSVALTERFIEVMESEHRELGLGDPTLGRKVQKLVGSLAGRVELWRAATAGERDWSEAAERSLYKEGVDVTALDHSSRELADFWSALQAADVGSIIGGQIR
jgi:cytochrome b pre-mRNA-processing protein 3